MKKLVVFNAPWCTTCTPFKQRLNDNGIEFVSAVLDTNADAELAAIFNVPEGTPVMQIASQHHVRALPTTLVVEGGVVVDVFVGSKYTEVLNAIAS